MTAREICQSCKKPIHVLTPAQSAVLRDMANLLSNGQIAQKLCISPKTVEAHSIRIAEALGIRSGARVVRFKLLVEAARQGLIPMDTELGSLMARVNWNDLPVGEIF